MTEPGNLDAIVAAAGGTVSVWVGPLGGQAPAYARLADVTHYAASTMKVGVLGALVRRHTAGDLDMDADVPVVNDFASALPGAPRFTMDREYDQDDDVWDRVGGTAPLRWLARRMIIRSSNLATNLVLAHVGVPAVHDLLAGVGTTTMTVNRGIEDAAAREAGIDNWITVRDLAILIEHVTSDPWAREVLLAQEYGEDLKAAVPSGTPVAQKDGWVEGARHSVGIVYPPDAPAYVIAVATTGADDAGTLITRIAEVAWAGRREI